jgi:hypothetical protein
MLVAAGARKAGRGELKVNLKRRIAAPQASASWTRFAAAAAVFGLVAGFGVYYALLNRGIPPPPLPVASAPPVDMPAPIARNEQDRPVQHAKTDAPQKQKEALRGISRDREDKHIEGSAVGGIARAQASDELSAAEPGEYWSDGIVTRPPEYLYQAAPAPAAKVSAESGANSLALKKSVKEEAHAMKDAGQGVREEYRVMQKPSSALPASRRKTRDDSNTVPTRIERQGSTTTMTMYLDSLVDEGELKGARVDALREDSVVVTLGGRKITYRLRTDQQGAQKRQK